MEGQRAQRTPDLRKHSDDYREGWRAALAWVKASGHWKALPRGNPKKAYRAMVERTRDEVDA